MSFIKIGKTRFNRDHICSYGEVLGDSSRSWLATPAETGEPYFFDMPVDELEAIIFGPDHALPLPAAPKQDATRTDGDLRLLDSLKEVDPMLAAGFARLLDTESRLIDVVCDGPPDHDGGRFVELEVDGFSVGAGEWVQRGDEWLLRLSIKEIKAAFGMVDRQREALKAEGE